MQHQKNYELHELLENFAAKAANKYELFRCAFKGANRLLSIRENLDVYVLDSEITFVLFV